ncbi:MAG TPA: alpha/beta hydrolase [Pseudobdellovibrionaceae bacterium]|nr:alpha/beta hydrolase [Pseudobdellovibrionaceae bacterium]
MAHFQLNDGAQLSFEVHPNLVPQNTLFIHGNLASNRWWYPALKVWQNMNKGKSYSGSLIFGEFRGCGHSTPPRTPSDISIKKLAEDYIDLIEGLNLAPVNVVGHSTGGTIAAMAMSMAPHLFRKAVLLDPVGAEGIKFDESMTVAFEAMKTDLNLVAAVMAGTIYQNDAASPFFKDIVVTDAHSAVKHVGPLILKALDGFDGREAFKKVGHPVLTLHGEHDNLLPMSDSQKLSSLFNNGTFEIIPGHGHCTNVENPEVFVKKVDSFLYA